MEVKPTIDENLKETEESVKMSEAQKLRPQQSIEVSSEGLSSQDESEADTNVNEDLQDDMEISAAARKRNRGRAAGGSNPRKRRGRSTKRPTKSRKQSSSRSRSKRGRGRYRRAAGDNMDEVDAVEIKKPTKGRPKAKVEAGSSKESKHTCKVCGGRTESFN